MTKFDQIIIEAEENINSAALDKANDAIQHLPDNSKEEINTALDKLGTQAGANHELLTKMADIFNDETPSKFSDLPADDQSKALELLAKSGLEVKPATTSSVSSTKPVTPVTPAVSQSTDMQTDNNTRSINPSINTKVQGAVV